MKLGRLTGLYPQPFSSGTGDATQTWIENGTRRKPRRFEFRIKDSRDLTFGNPVSPS